MATQTLPVAAQKPTASPTHFPFLDLQAQFEAIREEVMSAVTRTMESQRFILGPEVEALEKEIAEYVGCRFAIGCASGSDALVLALMALGVGPGDEVITTPFTFVATATAFGASTRPACTVRASKRAVSRWCKSSQTNDDA